MLTALTVAAGPALAYACAASDPCSIAPSRAAGGPVPATSPRAKPRPPVGSPGSLLVFNPARGFYRYRLAKDRLVRHLVARYGYDLDELARLAPFEFATISSPTRKQLRQYGRILLRSDARRREKLRGLRRMYGHYRRSRASTKPSELSRRSDEPQR